MADNFRPTKKQLSTMKSRFDEASEELAKTSGFSSAVPRDVQNASVSMETAPTKNPQRPRAKSIGYNSNTNTLYIVFRDNTWWEYRNVPIAYWIGLQNSASTGKYLSTVTIGSFPTLDTWSDMGPADLSKMSEEAKTRLADNASKSDRLQSSGLDEYLFGNSGKSSSRGNVKPKSLDESLFGTRG